MMKVRELIDLLQQLPPELPVMVHDAVGDHFSVMGGGELHCVAHLTTTLWIRPSTVLAAHPDEIIATLDACRFTNPRVFGSVLRGTDTPLSDLDLLVDGDGTMFDLGRAIADLNTCFGIRFQIHTPGSLADSFRAAVLTEACPLTRWTPHAGTETP